MLTYVMKLIYTTSSAIGMYPDGLEFGTDVNSWIIHFFVSAIYGHQLFYALM